MENYLGLFQGKRIEDDRDFDNFSTFQLFIATWEKVFLCIVWPLLTYSLLANNIEFLHAVQVLGLKLLQC